MNEYLEKLIDMGVTRWAISRYVGVSWQAVNMWCRGIWQPKECYQEKLKEYYFKLAR